MGKTGIPGKFETNNGVLALADFDGQVYIRGGDSYHGDLFGEAKKGVEGTLLNSGYEPKGLFVPHSNSEQFADPKKEKLFRALLYFSKGVRQLRGEATSGLIIKDLSEEEPEAPYEARKLDLPKIIIKETLLIPGDKDKAIVVD